MVTHRVVAWVAASAALYACAMTVASTRQRDALSPAGVTIATLVYVSFAVVLIVRWPPWLLAAVSTVGAVASMAAGTPDLLVGPALVAGMFVFSPRSEKTPAIAGAAAVTGVLLAGHLVFSLQAKTGGPMWRWCRQARSPAGPHIGISHQRAPGQRKKSEPDDLGLEVRCNERRRPGFFPMLSMIGHPSGE
jgi:hypothetical protein